jgi:Trypsin
MLAPLIRKWKNRTESTSTRTSGLPTRALALLIASTVFVACAGPSASVQATLSSDVKRVTDMRSEGVLAIATAHGAHYTLCSSALVAPNLILTARHCIAKAATATPSCDAAGRSHNGAHIESDVSPEQIAVYYGDAVRPGFDEPLARGVKTIHPDSQILCDADLAYILLDRPIHSVPTLPIRIHQPVAEGDVVVPIGYGGGRRNLVGTKVARAPSAVLAKGPLLNGNTGAVLGSREFEVENATCQGDSGGPAIDVKTGEIVGVVSRGGSCFKLGNHVYTRVDAFSKLTQRAFEASLRQLREEPERQAARQVPRSR